MAKYASFYAPINQALQNFNAQMNENYRRRMAAQHNLAQTKLAAAKFNAEMEDPRRVLAMQQAADQLTPTPIDISRFMPQGTGKTKYEMEAWNSFQPYVKNIVGDAYATIEPDGTLKGSDSKPLVVPRYKANQINNRLQAAQMLMFDEDSMREAELEGMNNNIKSLKEQQKKLQSPHLAMEIQGAQKAYERKYAEYNNPNRRLLALQNKMKKLDDAMMRAYTSHNPDQGWVSTLKDIGTRTQDEYNNLLKAMGKTGKAEGIQLKRYINPATGKVIELPVSKFDGAAFEVQNPIAGNVMHPGTWVLKDTATSPGGPMDAAREVNYFIDNYNRQKRSSMVLRNILQEGKLTTEMAKTLTDMDESGQLDPMVRIALSAGYDEDAVKSALADLEGAMDYKQQHVRKLYRDPTVYNALEDFFGTDTKPGKKDDPVGLLKTPTGKSKYSGTGAPDVLFQK